ncbi:MULTISPECIES: chemotaxis protein CheD [Haloferax]|uniref:chemotaxis protein CheD n=1 Tax=Haloferax TaxID=2251 RepID=UPI001CDA410B|nr:MULTISPECIES: chemotaxis protein CheD [Haloferax]
MKTFDFGDDDVESTREERLVGVSGYHVTSEGETLIAYGLGACIAIALWDTDSKVGALAHTLLPRQDTGLGASSGKYVDAAIQTMLREMVEAGAGYSTIEARLVGGADIFELKALGKGVGTKNVAVAREELDRLDVPIVAEATGGEHGRTVEFDTATGRLEVTTAHADDVEVL